MMHATPAPGLTRRAARAARLAARVATLRALGFTVTADGIIILTPPTEPAHAGA